MNTEATQTEVAAVAEQEALKTDTPKGRKAADKKASKAAEPMPAPKKDAQPAAKKEGKPAAKPAGKKASKTAVPNPKPGKPREGSKKLTVLDMLCRKDGATLAQIAEATGWQVHSIRGFISTITKKMDLPIASLKNAAGDRFYRIEK